MRRMRKCVVCMRYTLNGTHCGKATKSPHPPKFSIDDKYAQYRRRAKEMPSGDSQ